VTYREFAWLATGVIIGVLIVAICEVLEDHLTLVWR
jgi:hypothetical protein